MVDSVAILLLGRWDLGGTSDLHQVDDRDGLNFKYVAYSTVCKQLYKLCTRGCDAAKPLHIIVNQKL
jgi:hypothetical protein